MQGHLKGQPHGKHHHTDAGGGRLSCGRSLAGHQRMALAHARAAALNTGCGTLQLTTDAPGDDGQGAGRPRWSDAGCRETGTTAWQRTTGRAETSHE